jgi:PAS domain S-box-containing protein
VWRSDSTDEECVSSALAHALASYSWLAAGSSLVDRVSPPPSLRALPPNASAVAESRVEGRRRFVVMPLVVEAAHVFGALQVERTSAFDEDDVSFVNAVTNQAALAIHRQMTADAAEARVQSQLDFTRAITGSLGEGILATDANACISFLNPAAELILGCSERVVLGELVTEVLRVRHGDDDAGGLLACPLVRALETGVRVASEDHAFVGGDGRAVPVSYVASPIFGARGITGAVLAFRDVLAVKRSERVQRLLANCSAALGESLDRGRTVVALARCIVPGFADTCSVDLLAAAGDPHPSSPSFITVELRVRERTLGVLRLGMTESGRTYSDADRRVAEEIAHRTAVALENSRLHAQTEKAVRDRDEILAVVSHDMGSPLNTIVMAVGTFREKARRKEIDEADSRMIEIIGRAATRMTRLTRDLLDVSSIEANQLAIELKPTRIAAVVDDLLGALQATAGKQGLNLSVSHTDVTLLAHCDRDRILQVLANLVGNAIKFTASAGRIEVSIEPDGDLLRFVVRDTGAGISAELLPHVFERNRQAPETAAQGRGLGLFIAKGIVEAHGGRIRVESELGVGTAFEFCIPRVRATVARTTTTNEPQTEPVSHVGRAS